MLLAELDATNAVKSTSIHFYSNAGFELSELSTSAHATVQAFVL